MSSTEALRGIAIGIGVALLVCTLGLLALVITFGLYPWSLALLFTLDLVYIVSLVVARVQHRKRGNLNKP